MTSLGMIGCPIYGKHGFGRMIDGCHIRFKIILRLPEADRKKCIDGIIELQKGPPEKKVETFDDWISCSLGEG